MRVVRFRTGELERVGVMEGAEIRAVEGDEQGSYLMTDETFALAEVHLLAPCWPSKIVAVGLNYRDHAEETGMDIPTEPLLFLKPSSAVIGPGEEIVLPEMSTRVDYEGELAVVMGQDARGISPDEAHEYILGYTCFNDVTARDLQLADVQFTRAKGFDTFAPLGPWIENDVRPDALRIETRVNGEVKQASSTANLVFKVPELVSYISRVMTLFAGDVIATGTPAGIGPMKAGDRVEIEIEGIGVLLNRVISPAPAGKPPAVSEG